MAGQGLSYWAPSGMWAIFTLDFAVKELGSNPRKSEKRGTGFIDEVVSFGGVNFAPGHWLYSDDVEDLVSSRALHL